MTTREFYQAIVSANVSDELTAKATELISALDAKNAKRKTTGTKTQQENTEIKAKILSGMESEKVYTAKEIATLYELTSTQKASALLGQMVKNGDITAETVKTKSGKVVGYKIAETTENSNIDTEED